MRCGRLIDTNACPPCARGAARIIVYGRCLEQLHPDVLDSVLSGDPGFSACPEEHHVNMLGFKLAGMLARMPWVREVTVFTVDGSMHCVQLHFMVEEVFKVMGLGGRVSRRHLVYEAGRVVEVPARAVKAARYLSRVARLLGGSATPGHTSPAQ